MKSRTTRITASDFAAVLPGFGGGEVMWGKLQPATVARAKTTAPTRRGIISGMLPGR